FYINETKETIKTKHRPIVIITSNAEKELPDAFLRRCIFHYIEFPTIGKMEEIIRVHFKDIDKKLCENATEAFYKLRKVRDLQKKP
ncbi:MoxR family ATPase, partial [Acinetobacter baumannii]|nr:MoxR family ATPase [Acinetobacter baumannii]